MTVALDRDTDYLGVILDMSGRCGFRQGSDPVGQLTVAMGEVGQLGSC